MEPSQGPSLGLHGFLGVIRRHAILIVAVALTVIALALTYTARAAPHYESHARVEVLPLTVEEQLQPVSATPITNMETEAARVTQGAVAERAAEELGFDSGSRPDLERALQGVAVTVLPSTTYLDISCTRDTSDAARLCASAFAGSYVENRLARARDLIQAKIDESRARVKEARDRVAALEQEFSSASTPRQSLIRRQVNLLNGVIAEAEAATLSVPAPNPFAAVVSSSADRPEEPSNRNYVVIGVVAAMLGLLLGIGIALVRERWAEPVVDRLALGTALVAPVLAVVPDAPRRRDPSRTPTRLPVTGGPVAEGYRVAASMLLHLSRGDGPRCSPFRASTEEARRADLLQGWRSRSVSTARASWSSRSISAPRACIGTSAYRTRSGSPTCSRAT